MATIPTPAPDASAASNLTIPSCFPNDLLAHWQAYLTAARTTKAYHNRPSRQKHDLYLALLTDPNYHPDPSAFPDFQNVALARLKAGREYLLKHGKLYHFGGAKYNKPQRVVQDEEVLDLLVRAHMSGDRAGTKQQHNTLPAVFNILKKYHDITRDEVSWISMQCSLCKTRGGRLSKNSPDTSGKRGQKNDMQNDEEDVSTI